MLTGVPASGGVVVEGSRGRFESEVGGMETVVMV